MPVSRFCSERPAQPLAEGETWKAAPESLVSRYSHLATAKDPGWVLSHHGLVVRLGERNYHDDSDFFAVVYNPERDDFTTVDYGTTRAWTYLNGAEVDAPEHLIERYRAEGDRTARALAALEAERRARKPEVGKVVRATRTFKSKGVSYAAGTEFEIFWTGTTYGSLRLGLKPVEGGPRLFTAATNVEVLIGLEVA